MERYLELFDILCALLPILIVAEELIRYQKYNSRSLIGIVIIK